MYSIEAVANHIRDRVVTAKTYLQPLRAVVYLGMEAFR